MSESHEEAGTLIKTPGQLIAAVVLSFVVFVGLALLVAQLVTSGHKGMDSANEEIVARAIQPVATLELGSAAPAGPRSGEDVYKGACAACHGTGAAGAPKLGDNAAWGPRLAQGLEGLLKSAIGGKNAMPPRAGNPALKDDELARAIVYMANQSGGSLKEPAADAAK